MRFLQLCTACDRLGTIELAAAIARHTKIAAAPAAETARSRGRPPDVCNNDGAARHAKASTARARAGGGAGVIVREAILRPARQEFSLFMWASGLGARLVEPPPHQATSLMTRRHFAAQWSESNPRFTAAHCVESYLEPEGIARLGAGGTLYSDEPEILDVERDYWQSRVAVDCDVAQVGDGRFWPGNTTRSRRLEPTARKQTRRALDIRATADGEEFLRGPARRRAVKADRALGHRLPRR
jgi:hypothetical protein